MEVILMEFIEIAVVSRINKNIEIQRNPFSIFEFLILGYIQKSRLLEFYILEQSKKVDFSGSKKVDFLYLAKS